MCASMHVYQFCVTPPYLPCSLLPKGIQKSVGMEKFRQVQSTLLQQRTCTALLFPCSKSKGLSHKRAEVECGVIRSFPEVVPGQWNLHKNNMVFIHCSAAKIWSISWDVMKLKSCSEASPVFCSSVCGVIHRSARVGRPGNTHHMNGIQWTQGRRRGGRDPHSNNGTRLHHRTLQW